MHMAVSALCVCVRVCIYATSAVSMIWNERASMSTYVYAFSIYQNLVCSFGIQGVFNILLAELTVCCIHVMQKKICTYDVLSGCCRLLLVASDLDVVLSTALFSEQIMQLIFLDLLHPMRKDSDVDWAVLFPLAPSRRCAGSFCRSFHIYIFHMDTVLL